VKGAEKQFTATVTGDNDLEGTVSWTIETEGVNEGTTLVDGLLKVALAETKTEIIIKATSTEDTTKSGTATVTITNPPAVTSVTVAPKTISVVKGGSATFTATVVGTDSPATTVTWSIVETDVATGTAINAATGVLSIGAAEATGKVITVKATSTADVSKSDTATATVSADPPTVTSMSVTPATATVMKGETKQFSALLVGNPTPPQDAVEWTVAGGITGTKIEKNAAGALLTVAAGETAATLTVKAASTVAGYTDKFATATVTVTGFSFFELGAFDDGAKTWNSNGTDNVTTTLEMSTIKSAKYFIAKIHTPMVGGMGGLQIAVNGDGTSWDEKQTDFVDNGWVNLGVGNWGDTDVDYYIVVKLDTLTGWADLISGNQAKFTLNWPAGWSNVSSDGNSTMEFVKGYFASGADLTKPSTLTTDLEKSGTTYGWFAKTVPEMAP